MAGRERFHQIAYLIGFQALLGAGIRARHLRVDIAGAVLDAAVRAGVLEPEIPRFTVHRRLLARTHVVHAFLRDDTVV
ncbi:MAG: hypothetical protein BWX80_03884 [Candidatus Hydrogenedentes bacterium ADurb.Bin101]|nr:MAG: hypothetical protein BWX80_03884 [Candidatus Hydrogenedentes bacterium ADurb.Bin101]